MKKTVLGILAAVDAGKTTLSEALLYQSGIIREAGRVDKGDTFFDTNEIERKRGITVFSKQAVLALPHTEITFLDTPGHVDFSAEMERVLSVLDYAVLLISAPDGITGYTQTLWNLLEEYHIPVMIFVNKMDQRGTDRNRCMKEIQARLGQICVDFSDAGADDLAGDLIEGKEYLESLALCDEQVLERYLATGEIPVKNIKQLVKMRKMVPCFFGSALKMEGTRELMSAMDLLTLENTYPEDFRAVIFKIARNAKNQRLSYLKVTGGTLHVKDFLAGEKVNEIRIYSGEKYTLVDQAQAGTVCAVTGPAETSAGEIVGSGQDRIRPALEPVLVYQMQWEEDVRIEEVMPKLKELEEEDPMLQFTYQEALSELFVHVMGEVQLEVLKSIIEKRFGLTVSFSHGSILYKETIKDIVEGVGHYEPLRHYAEVHIKLEPLPQGSGIEYENSCPSTVLDSNWQNLIMTHLKEKEHCGVLTGAPLTDVRYTLLAGRNHKKHTEGGDFRQATYRAVRQGLMQAESVLLEPYFEYRLEVPAANLGRAMTDLERMHADFTLQENGENIAVLVGNGPVATLRDYQREVHGYTSGNGRFSCRISGYYPCHDQEKVVAAKAYDPDADISNPSGSVFCAHGSGFFVPWDQVPEYMHLPFALQQLQDFTEEAGKTGRSIRPVDSIDQEEIDRIFRRTFHSNEKNTIKKPKSRSTQETLPKVRKYKETPKKEHYMLVDGYNVIFAWPELAELAKENLDGARGKLLDILSEYQAMKGCHLIAVFDAYRVKNHKEEMTDFHNIHVVFTKEAETADAYIERFTTENYKHFYISVVTSDGLEQIIIVSHDCHLISSREFQKEFMYEKQKLKEEFMKD